MDQQKNRRLFFALWPDEVCRTRLTEVQRHLVLEGKRARYVPAANMHITLHYIGNTTADKLHCLQRQAAEVEATAFDLALDTLGYFKKPQVSWLGCQLVPEALLVLHRLLGERLKPCGFQVENRHYNPHVTMIRKQQSRQPDSEVETIDWKVNDFVLVESVSVVGGVRYDILERYPLN